MATTKQKVYIDRVVYHWWNFNYKGFFFYKDNFTKRWFLIATLGNTERQGIGFTKREAYDRLAKQLNKIPKLESIKTFDNLQKVYENKINIQ